ncbi:Detected protein of unknown function [Hibiscus syriacus]|uniref:Uncharacterized protein n=1 Tax=Hibiscus syriacus TaxID=106335 RepID=A0A6A2YJ66_HIBSY|nr:Detected protein of unknown function [Hibiscus syriacus]
MANPRRNSYSTSQSSDINSFQFQTQSSSSLSSLKHLLKKPHAIPFLLLFLLFLTWVSLRLQYSSSSGVRRDQLGLDGPGDEDSKANLVRFKSGLPSPIVKDKRGWLLDPVSPLRFSLASKGGQCLAHKYTLVKLDMVSENKMVDRGYAEVTIEEDEVVVAASPSGTAHALVNVDALRSTFFLGCQDGMVNTNSSNTDFNVWKDL